MVFLCQHLVVFAPNSQCMFWYVWLVECFSSILQQTFSWVAATSKQNCLPCSSPIFCFASLECMWAIDDLNYCTHSYPKPTIIIIIQWQWIKYFVSNFQFPTCGINNMRRNLGQNIEIFAFSLPFVHTWTFGDWVSATVSGNHSTVNGNGRKIVSLAHVS